MNQYGVHVPSKHPRNAEYAKSVRDEVQRLRESLGSQAALAEEPRANRRSPRKSVPNAPKVKLASRLKAKWDERPTRWQVPAR